MNRLAFDRQLTPELLRIVKQLRREFRSWDKADAVRVHRLELRVNRLAQTVKELQKRPK